MWPVPRGRCPSPSTPAPGGPSGTPPCHAGPALSAQASQWIMLVSPLDDTLDLAHLGAGESAEGQNMYLCPERKAPLQPGGNRGSGLVPMLFAARRQVGQFADDDEAGHRLGAVDDEEVLRGQGRLGEQDRLDLARVDVDAPDDQHVVGATDHLRHADEGPAAGTWARIDSGDIAGPVAQDRHGLPGQRGEDQLAKGPWRQRRAGGGVDNLREEVVFVDVQPALRLDAFAGDAGADDLREPVDVERLQAEQRLDLDAHRLGPWLGTEDAGS